MPRILEREFGRSLADEDVHIIDPFVGTGNFIVRMMREIPRTALERKYASELHCNEVMLLPHYIASMNIEHEYNDATNRYEPFKGICLKDSHSARLRAIKPGLSCFNPLALPDAQESGLHPWEYNELQTPRFVVHLCARRTNAAAALPQLHTDFK